MKQLLVVAASVLSVSGWTQLFSYAETETTASDKAQAQIDEVQTMCMDIFSKSFGNDTDALSTCTFTKAGVNNYSYALALWKQGVAEGTSIGSEAPGIQGAADAEMHFRTGDHHFSAKLNAIRNGSIVKAQKATEDTLSGLKPCVQTGAANMLLESGKSCGQTTQEALSSDTYQEAYEIVCMGRVNDLVKCRKISNEAYLNYLRKKKKRIND